MRISKIIIKGFRCFGYDGVIFESLEDLNVFVGHNSSGKTAALEALVKLFGRTKNEREIRKNDFYRTGKKNDLTDGCNLSIEVQLNFSADDSSVPILFQNMTINDSNSKPYVRIRLDAVWKEDPRNADGIVEQEINFWQNPECDDELNPCKKVFKSSDLSLFQVYYVPALRKTSDELKYSSNSLLQRMLKLISYEMEFKQKTVETLKTIDTSIQENQDFSTIKSVLMDSWAKFHKDARFDNVEIGMLCDDVEQFLRKLDVTFTSNVEGDVFQINDLGDGNKSLFYLSMICSLLESEHKLKRNEELPLITFFAIEEPENHISPHLLGRVINVLMKISKKDFVQVFVSSHSPSIVGRVNPSAIYHFQNRNSLSIVNKVELPSESDEAYKFIKEAVQHWPEIYFSKLVVIGEGDSEEVVFKYLSKHFDCNFDENEITFFPLGHRFIHHIWKLLENLQISYITLLDLDQERSGGGWGRIKYILQEMQSLGKCDDIFWKGAPYKFRHKEVETLHKWDFGKLGQTLANLHRWIDFLESYNIFFSTPLDIDYLLLSLFENEYTKVIDGDGPDIPPKKLEYEHYLQNAVHHTLKSDNREGDYFSRKEKELMIWYKYLFLGRGKPITHVQHLPNIEENRLRLAISNSVLGRILERIGKLVNGI